MNQEQRTELLSLLIGKAKAPDNNVGVLSIAQIIEIAPEIAKLLNEPERTIEQLENDIQLLFNRVKDLERVVELYKLSATHWMKVANEFDTSKVSSVNIICNEDNVKYSELYQTNDVKLSFQDNGRTLKVFINQREK